MNKEKPMVLQLIAKIKLMNDYMHQGIFKHIYDPQAAIDNTEMAYRLLIEIRDFYKECVKNKTKHEEKIGGLK